MRTSRPALREHPRSSPARLNYFVQLGKRRRLPALLSICLVGFACGILVTLVAGVHCCAGGFAGVPTVPPQRNLERRASITDHGDDLILRHAGRAHAELFRAHTLGEQIRDALGKG